MTEKALNGTSLRTMSLLFAAVIAAFSVWILALPLMPTQDGPMHRYYVHVLDAVLHHSTLYSVYRIRHPFPPYATHYGILLALSHVVSYDTAEKLFTVLIVVCFAYGFRFCALGCGPSGNLASFFVAPLLFHWALMMGFMNYSLALGLFLGIAGCWLRAIGGRETYWIPFALLVCLLTVTHPVPLLILIALCAFDLLLRALLLRSRAERWQPRRLVFALAALVFCLLAFQLPAASLQKHAATSVFADMGLHPRSLAQMLLLAGVSPYYTVTHAIIPNLYRLILYGILLVCLIVGARTLRLHWAERRLAFSDTFFLSTLLLALAIPILPDYVNGSGYFATRMVVLLWVGALVAVSGAALPAPSLQRKLQWSALACAGITLLGAEMYFRPEAVQLKLVELQSIPANQAGLLFNGLKLDDYVHHHYQTAFDPFTWGPALAFVHSNDVMLDSPWIDQNIAPLQAVPGSPLLVDDIRMTHLSKTDHGFKEGASLPVSREGALVHASTILIDADTPEQLSKGIGEQLRPEEASRFHCAHVNWYLVCTALSQRR